MKKETAYSRWYAKNKDVLAERRKKKYHSDPEHRDRILEASKEWRKNHSRAKPPYTGEYPLLLSDVADLLDVNPSTLRDWQLKGYFPKPKRVGGAYRFTTNQANMLGKIKQFFDEHGSRKGAKMSEFEGLAGLILANW